MQSLLKVTITAAFIFLSATLFAQGNLQFSQVLNYNLSITGGGSVTYAKDNVTLTVPAGKVWKIESGHLSEQITSSSAQYYVPGGYLLLDGSIIAGESSNNYDPKFPIWLSPGTYTLTLQGGTNSSNYYWYGFVSIIEFNVTTP